jgi:hypothetical protein
MKKELEEIVAYMKSKIKFGACDSEPMATLRFVINNAQKGGEYLCDPEAWELYSDMPGAAIVEKKLDRLGKALHDAIRLNHDPIREYLD